MSVSDSASAPAFSLHEVTPTSRVDFAVLDEATADLEPPFAVIDVGALRSNADALVRRAAGKPVRVASKSVRCLAITTAVLDLDGFAGILALTLPEALLLARSCQDVVVGYPTTDRRSLMTLASDPVLAQRITLMVDAPEHLDLIENAAVPDGPPIRVCLDLDASLRLLDGRVHLGPRRSPLHSP